MSASKQKKTRMEQRADGPSKKAAAAAEQARKDKAFRIKAIIAVAVIVVIVAAALLINSNLFYTRTTAAQVGSTKYSPAEVNYFYKTTYNRIYEDLYNQFGSSMSMLLDTTQPLNTQYYTEDQTWADHVFETAQDDMKQVTVFYDAAIRDGYTPTEADTSAVEQSVEQMRSYADNSGLSLRKFLAAYFGKGMTEATFRSLSEKVAIASRYSQDLLNSLSFSDEELDAYYAEHAEEMDLYNYYLYTVSTSNDKFSELDDSAKAQAAHDAALEITSADSEEAYIANVHAFAGEDATVRMSSTTKQDLGSSYQDWITAADRKPGDTTVVDTDTGSYAIFYVGFNDNNYSTVDMRHILVMVETDENGAYTEEAKAAAEEKLRGIESDWQLLGATEEAFASLADQYTDDSGSNANGGLYTDITKNYMVPVVNDFLFASGRKPGDTEIVFNDGSYVGYHLLYFVGENQNYRRVLAKDALTSERYNETYEQMAASYDFRTGSGLKYANLT